MSIRIARILPLRVRRLALLVGCALATTGVAVWLPDSQGHTLATHLVALLLGGAAVAAFGSLHQRVAAAPIRISESECGSAQVPTVVTHSATATDSEQAALTRLALASEFAGIGIWDWDVHLDRLQLDPHTTRALGFAGQQIPTLRQLLRELAHSEDLAELEQALDQALRSELTLQHSVRLRHADGSTHHCQLRARLFREQQRAVRMLIVVVDITQLVQAHGVLEHAIRQERAVADRLSLATQVGGLSVWDHDLVNDSVLLNPMPAGGAPAVPLHVPCGARARFTRMVHPDDLAHYNSTLDAALASGDTFEVRVRLRHADQLIYVQLNGRIFRDPQGCAVRLLGVTRDISNEVRAAERLWQQSAVERTALERLDLATQTAGLAVWDMDASQWELDPAQWQLVADQRLYQLLECAPGASVSELMSKIVAEDVPPALAGIIKAMREGSESETTVLHFRVHGANGIRHFQGHVRAYRDGADRPRRLLGVTWEVTSQVQHAAQLQSLLDRFSVVMQAVKITPWEIDPASGQFIWIENQLKHAGLDDVPLADYSRRLQALLHPDDLAASVGAARRALKSGADSYEHHFRVVLPSGVVRHMRSFAHLVRGPNGRLQRLVGATTDITNDVQTTELLQRQAAQERSLIEQLEQQAQRLQAAERRLERASLSSSEGHWESNLVQGQMWFSSSFHALLGYEDGELQAADSLEQLVHPHDVSVMRQSLAAHFKDGVPYSVDARLRTRSGAYRWFRQRGAAERDADGQPTAIAGSIHDIHEQKRAEDALNLAQRRFERAINGTQDGLWELESDGKAWCSPRVAELLGHTPDSFASDTNFLRTYLHPDDAGAVAAATQAHFQQEQPYDVEIRLRCADDSYRWYRARASAERDVQGRPLRLSGSLQEVTEARAAREELLRATQAAEAASNAKSAFLANVSHEIRTPMNGIIGMSGLLLETALDRTQRDYAETIRSSADSLLIVINDILDFSKIEAGKLDIEAIEMSLRDTIEDVGSMLALQAAARNLELIVDLHADVPWRVIGDPQRVRQCLINLVSNAIKFTRSGEVVIEISNAGQRDGALLTRLEVRDTGIGIAPETLSTLFQPFVQADSSTTRHFGGTGLGLSIVRRLVEMMGGSIGVDSVVGQGSRFWFILPLEPVTHTQQVVDLTHLGRRVLVVDDNASARRVLTSQLRQAGYEATAASTGTEALKCLQHSISERRPYEAVVADYQLPDMDAAALGQHITHHPQLSSARLVVLTSLDRHGDIARFTALGFAGYLRKPVRTRELFDCLDRVLAKEAREWHLQTQPIVTRTSLASTQARRCRGHVLLVEDNPVNQKVALRFLERIGCTVRVADNGAEGVKAFREAHFDMVLMDLQMPVMDGLTATREMRALQSSGAQTPIVALTANAMTGQLECCLKAGMNGFLSKPLEPSQLQETLERHGLSGSRESPEVANTVTLSPVNTARWQELTAGDAEFATELAGAFIASAQQVLEEILSALAGFDRSALSRAAHKLKGACANIHAEPLRALANELESHSASLDQARLKDLVQKLRMELERTAKFMEQHCAPSAAAC